MTKTIGWLLLGSVFLWSLLWMSGFTDASVEESSSPPAGTKAHVRQERSNAAPERDENLGYLRKKIRMLEERILEQERNSESCKQPLQADEERVISKEQVEHDGATSYDADEPRQHEGQVEEYYSNLMAEDVPDTGGSVEAEEELHGFLRSLDLKSSAVTTVECRKKLCKVVLDHADESGHRTLSEAWGPGPFGEGSLQHLQEDGTTVVYAARRGQALPTLPSDTH